MSAENKFSSSHSKSETNDTVQNVTYQLASRQHSQLRKDPICSGGQSGGHSVQSVGNQHSPQNVPKVIITSGQRQSQTSKTAKRNTLIEVPINGRHQQGQMSSHSNEETVNSPSQEIGRNSSMEDLCREKEGAPIFKMASSGNDPIPTSLRAPPANPSLSKTLSSLPCHPSQIKIPQRNVTGSDASRSQLVPHKLFSPPKVPQAGQLPATYLHAVPPANINPLTQNVLPHAQPPEKNPSQNLEESRIQKIAALSAAERPEALSNVSPKNLPVKTFPMETLKDPDTCQKKDEGTVEPHCPSSARNTLGSTAFNELKAPIMTDSCLPPTEIYSPDKSLGQSIVTQPFRNSKDPHTDTYHQRDQGTVGPAVISNISRTSMCPTTSSDLKPSNMKDKYLPSNNVSTLESSKGQCFMKQPSGNPKDAGIIHKRDAKTVGPPVLPNTTTISLEETAPSDLKACSNPGNLPSTTLSTGEKTSGQVMVKQPSVSPKDPRRCLQKDLQNVVPAVSSDATQNTSSPTVPSQFKASRSNDGSTLSTKGSKQEEVSEQPELKQPKVVLKRLKHCVREKRNPDETRSTTKELHDAYFKLRSSIDAITKDEDKKSVSFSNKMSPHPPSMSKSISSKHHLLGHSSSASRALHGSSSKTSSAKDSQFHSRKHLLTRSKSFSYSSSWKTPHKVQVLQPASSDPSGKLKQTSSFDTKLSSGQAYGKHSARALSYNEEKKSLPLSTSKTVSISSTDESDQKGSRSDQKGSRMRNKSSSNSTVFKQNAPSPSHKVMPNKLEANSFQYVAETLSDSEANVKKAGPPHIRQKNKPAKPRMVEKKSQHSPNQPLNQHLLQNEGKTKDSSSSSQRNSTFAASENQPSFMQLLEIASKNASVKGSQAGNYDWQYSRKRRYSDGQINKCQPTDPRHFMRPFDEGVSSIKIPKLERLSENIGDNSNSGEAKSVKDKGVQRSIVTPGKDKEKVGEVSDTGKGVDGPTAGIAPRSISYEGRENSRSVDGVTELSSSSCNKMEERGIAADDGNDKTMSGVDTPGMIEDVEITSQSGPAMDEDDQSQESNEKKQLPGINILEMLEEKEKTEEVSASKKDLKDGSLTGVGVQGLFSELQKSGEESKGSNSSSPSRSPKTSFLSGSEKKLLNKTSLQKVKHILSGIVLKKQTSVDSDASTKDGSSSSTPSPVPSGDEKQQVIPPPVDEDTKEAESGLMDEVDIFTAENDSESSEDDDDSFLQLKPSALIEETNALMDAPMPVTPSKMTHSQVSYSPVLLHPTRTKHQGTVERPKVGYTLDKILHMKIDQDMKDGDITAIRDKLMDGVSRGGIAKLATETVEVDEDIDVDPEAVDYPAYLSKFPTKSEKIPDIPPGEDIFNPKKICQLFTPTQCLCVKNFLLHKENQTSMESLLLSATSEEVEEVITSGCLELCESIQDDMMRWMFLLMSIHPSAQENHLLYQTQWMHLNKAPLVTDELRFPWIPSLKDILTVLLNYGGDLAGLVSVSDCELEFSEEMLRDEFSHGQVNASSDRRDVCFKEEEGIFVMILKNHLCQVIKILTQAILTHIALKDCSGYRTEELQCLLIIMMRIALDKTVIGLPVAVDITMAIAAILEGFEDSVWHQEVERMCVLFPLITSHHHNMVYLLWSCMPLHIERGRYLCRRLSYAGLQNLVLPEKNTQRLSSSLDQNVPSIKISSLIPILQCCKPSTATDYYQLYSIIHLLDYSIGNEVLEIYEKRELDQIIRKLREMVGDIRESTLSLCRSQVKSLIVRTATKLSFMTQSMVTNQESIFSFLRSDTPIGVDKDEEEGNPEHHIRSQDDAASLPSDDDGDDNGNGVQMETFSDEEGEAKHEQTRVGGDAKDPCDSEGEGEQRAKEGDKKLDFEEQGGEGAQSEVLLSVQSGETCVKNNLGESEMASSLEPMETSVGKGDQLNPEISNFVGEEVSKEIQVQPEMKEGAEKSKISADAEENQLEPEIQGSLEVKKTTESENFEPESEISSDVRSKENELQPEITVNIEENTTSVGKDLQQNLKISVDVKVVETSECKDLKQKPHDSGGLEVEETPGRNEVQIQPDEKVAVQAQELSLDSETQAAALSDKSLSSKDVPCKSEVQVPVETKDVPIGMGEGGKSSIGKEKKTHPDVVDDGTGLIKEVTAEPLTDQVIPPEEETGASCQKKTNVWVPVKLEPSLSPVEGVLVGDAKKPASVSTADLVLPPSGGEVFIEVENEEQVVDLTSPVTKDVSMESGLVVIDLESDDKDEIYLD